MNENLKITIIVPVYKTRLDYLKECFDSLANQTVDKSIYEVILVDDNNNLDECGTFCDEYVKFQSNFTVLHKVNAGVSEARNLGIKKANAPYLAFVDADDWVEPNMIEVMLSAQNGCPEADLWIFRYFEYDRNKKITNQNNIYPFSEKVVENIDDLQMSIVYPYPKNPIIWVINGPFCKLYKKENILKFNINFNSKLKIGEDGILNLYYLQTCKTVFVQNKSVYHYRYNIESATKKQNTNIVQILTNYQDALFIFIEKFNKSQMCYEAWLMFLLHNITSFYQLYFKYDSWGKQQEFKKLLNTEHYQKMFEDLDLSNLSMKERFLLLILRTKNLILLKIIYSGFQIIKRLKG